MNCTVYLFGEFGLGYTQYPQDGAEDIFRHIASRAEAQTQIAIHRDGNLMYYVYLRRLDEGEGHYIGYGFRVEGLLFRDLSPLFDLFGSTFENIVIADRLLTLNMRGHVVANVGLLIEKRQEVERLINQLCNSVLALSSQFIPLPKAIFDHLSTQVWVFGEDADPNDIRKASQMSGYTIVQKGRMQVATDIPVVPVPIPEKKEKKEPEKPEPEKKSDIVQEEPKTPVVKPVRKSGWDGMKTFLLMLLLLSLGGLAYTIWQLKSANQLESEAMTSYNKVKMTNAELHQKVTNLETQLEASNLKAQELEKALIRRDSVITALRNYYRCNQPLLATSLFLTRESPQSQPNTVVGTHIRGSNDLKLQAHIRYFGMEKASIRLTLRWTYPRRVGFFDFGDFSFGTKSHDDVKIFDIETGEHQLDFDVWNGDSRNRWEPGKYSIELWSGNECLQRKEFWVD